MSSVEETELKAGHPPAEKVGGMRVSRPHHATAPNDKEEQAKKQEEKDEEVESPPKPNPHLDVLVSGAINKEEKAFPVEAVKHYHDKPHTQPSREHKHDNKAKFHIQQPR